ncbi:hypothetical protein AVEN_107169-1 [Araneus ventricosus]|uniref:Uncharacterized protein n=1 Tax=Araneus ventricosus TaxID=182803 RepID=A0A4Y2FED2_ARAVE|nr:hypothetical protein AVEN_107169-1 [Araneus ventricosus]
MLTLLFFPTYLEGIQDLILAQAVATRQTDELPRSDPFSREDTKRKTVRQKDETRGPATGSFTSRPVGVSNSQVTIYLKIYSAPLHYATKCRLTLCYHLRCPADQHIEAWMKLINNHRLLTNKIIDLLNFIASQEDLLKSEQPG